MYASTSARTGAGVKSAFKSVIDAVSSASSRPQMYQTSNIAGTKQGTQLPVVISDMPSARALKQAGGLTVCPRLLYLCSPFCPTPLEKELPRDASPKTIQRVRSRQELASAALQVFDDDDPASDDVSEYAPTGGYASDPALDSNAGASRGTSRAPSCAEQQRS